MPQAGKRACLESDSGLCSFSRRPKGLCWFFGQLGESVKGCSASSLQHLSGRARGIRGSCFLQYHRAGADEGYPNPQLVFCCGRKESGAVSLVTCCVWLLPPAENAAFHPRACPSAAASQLCQPENGFGAQPQICVQPTPSELEREEVTASFFFFLSCSWSSQGFFVPERP